MWGVRVQERDGERWGGEERGEREKVSSGMLEARGKTYFHFMAVPEVLCCLMVLVVRLQGWVWSNTCR